jgi:hypothetical protein
MPNQPTSTVVHPDELANFTGRNFHDWNEWRELWDSTKLWPIQESLIHNVFWNEYLDSQTRIERIIFLLRICDEEAISFPYFVDNEAVYNRWPQLRRKVRTALALNVWRKVPKPGRETQREERWELNDIFRSPELLEALVWFFRPNADYGDPRNLLHPSELKLDAQINNDHVEALWRKFAIGLVQHLWDTPTPRTEGEDTEMRQRLIDARAKLVHIWGFYRVSHLILERAYKPDAKTLEALTKYAIKRSDRQDKKPKSLIEIASGSFKDEPDTLVARNLLLHEQIGSPSL